MRKILFNIFKELKNLNIILPKIEILYWKKQLRFFRSGMLVNFNNLEIKVFNKKIKFESIQSYSIREINLKNKIKIILKIYYTQNITYSVDRYENIFLNKTLIFYIKSKNPYNLIYDQRDWRKDFFKQVLIDYSIKKLFFKNITFQGLNKNE